MYYLLYKLFLSTRQKKQLRNFLEAAKDPYVVQAEVLNSIVCRNKNSVFGQKYRFQDIGSVEDYRANVPVSTFEDLRNFNEQHKGRSSTALTTEEVVYYNRTSGTTDTPKDVPITETGMSELKHFAELSAYVLTNQSNLLAGKVFAIGGAAEEARDSMGIPIGSASGLLYRQQPGFLRSRYVIPPDVFDIRDPDIRYQTIAIYGLRQRNVTAMATANPSTFNRLNQVINEEFDGLIAHIERGTLPTSEVKLPRLRPHPKRADELRTLRYLHGDLSFVDFWKRLRGAVVWCGGSCAFALVQLRKRLYFDTKVVELGYQSSEFRGTINVEVETNTCLPTFQHVFYEFVSVEDWENDKKEFLGLHQLKLEELYYIFVTTCNGLYRYNINDVVRCTGFLHQTPTLEFVQKGRGVTNISGEKLTEHQILVAMETLSQQYQLEPEFFVVVADPKESKYLLCLELGGAECDPTVARTFDEILQDLNIEYAQKRSSKRLNDLQVVQLPSGTGAQYRMKLIETGQRDSQFKYQHLQYLNDIMQALPVDGLN